MHLDWQILRLAMWGVSPAALAKSWCPLSLALALVMWAVAERRTRNAWRSVLAPRTRSDGLGPYRAASLPTFHERAPWSRRAPALLGFAAGAFGLLWPLLFLLDVLDGSWGWRSRALEVVFTFFTVWSLRSARALLRVPESAQRAFVRIAVGLLGLLACAWFLGAFDGIEITVHGLKKYEAVMPLGRFLAHGFGLFAGDHAADVWRLLLGAAAVQSFLLAAFVVAQHRARRAWGQGGRSGA